MIAEHVPVQFDLVVYTIIELTFCHCSAKTFHCFDEMKKLVRGSMMHHSLRPYKLIAFICMLLPVNHFGTI